MTEENLTPSLEDYLEAFYELVENKQGARAVDIAKKLNVKRPSVTKALKNLSMKGMVNYEKYDVVSLTEEGKAAALNIIKKHKLFLDFFVGVLGVEFKEASSGACKIEHVISEGILDRLLKFMEYLKREENVHIAQNFKKIYESKK